MPVTRFTLILGLGHCQEAPKDLAQLPPPAQVLSPLLLASRGPDSPVAATIEVRGLQASLGPAVLPSLLSQKGSSKYTQATPHPTQRTPTSVSGKVSAEVNSSSRPTAQVTPK